MTPKGFRPLPIQIGAVDEGRAREFVEAIQMLDTLRAARHESPSLRMVFCGSLGLHIVLSKLQESGYSGRPVNDMPPFDVPPLSSEAATYLAGCLLLGQSVRCSDERAVAGAVGEANNRVPFYIQHAVRWMRTRPDEEWTPDAARRVPDELFEATGDPAEFSYYDDRLDEHYPDDVVGKARAALDLLSAESQGLDFDVLLNLVRHRPETMTLDPDGLRRTLETLRDDHYLVQREERWSFKLEILRRWWWRTRGESSS